MNAGEAGMADLKAPMIDALQFSNWNRARLEDLHRAGLTAVHATICYHGLARETLSSLAAWNRRFREHADIIRPVRRPEDLDAARAEERVGVILGAQNCSPIEDEIGLVEVMRDAGLAVMQVTYNGQSLLGAGCYEDTDSGISRFGREVLREMNRVGMVIDLSHSGERTMLDAIELSKRPVAITHANPCFVHDIPRNKSNAVLTALAESGGMLGFSLYPMHLPGGARTSIESFSEMVARTADLMGVERIGIGSDLCLGWGGETIDWMRNGRWRLVPYEEREALAADAWPAQPEWFSAPSDMKTLAEALTARGFGAAEVAAIMGGNWHRFFVEGLRPLP